MFQQTYFVDKQTGTFADVCSAYGLATILDQLLQHVLSAHDSRTVKILDRGTTYAIEITPAVQEGWIEKLNLFEPIPFIRTSKNSKTMPEGINNIDYEEEKRVYNEYRESRRILRQTMNRGVSESDAPQSSKPSPEYPVWQKINMMSGISAYNAAITNWHENRGDFAALIKLLLTLHAKTPNPVAACEQEWKTLKKERNFIGKDRLNMLQVFNPSTGKGQNTPKANNLSMKNVNNFWIGRISENGWFLPLCGAAFRISKTRRATEGPENLRTSTCQYHIS